MSVWTSYENGIKKNYLPTGEDLKDLKEAFGEEESKYEAVSRAFKAGVSGQIGMCAAIGLNSVVSSQSNSNNLSNKKVLLCGSQKVTQSDLQRMEAHLQASEAQLAQAEAVKNQAMEATRLAHKQLLNDLGTHNIGDVCYESFPEIVTAKQEETRACNEYNRLLLKLGQEEALYSKMERKFEKENNNNGGDSTIWIGIGSGFIYAVVRLISFSF